MFLRSEGASERVIAALQENELTGEMFLQLKDCDLKELAPLLADRLLLRKIQTNSSAEGSTSDSPTVTTASTDQSKSVGICRPIPVSYYQSNFYWSLCVYYRL